MDRHHFKVTRRSAASAGVALVTVCLLGVAMLNAKWLVDRYYQPSWEVTAPSTLSVERKPQSSHNSSQNTQMAPVIATVGRKNKSPHDSTPTAPVGASVESKPRPAHIGLRIPGETSNHKVHSQRNRRCDGSSIGPPPTMRCVYTCSQIIYLQSMLQSFPTVG